MRTLEVDVAVVGAGPAGLSAAIGAARDEECKVLVLERDERLGGILNQCIHNGFGLHRFNEELTGPEYASRDVAELKKHKNITVMTGVFVVDYMKEKTLVAVNRDGVVLVRTKAIVLAMGCRERPRGALSIPGARPSGIFSAGCAQRLMNIDGFKVGNRIVILGSGDIGLIMARRMCLEGAKVEGVYEIMPYSNGLKRNIVQCLEDYNIPLYTSHTVTKIYGEDRITGVEISKVDENLNPIEGTCFNVECDTLLLSVGLIPENELTCKMGLTTLPSTKGISVDEFYQSEKEGIFACGNVLHVHDLVDFVSKEGERAGKSAALYAKGERKNNQFVTVECKDALGYVLPQRISARCEKDITFYMRVKKPVKNKAIVVKSHAKVIKTKRSPAFNPSEMIELTVKKEEIQNCQGNLEFSLE